MKTKKEVLQKYEKEGRLVDIFGVLDAMEEYAEIERNKAFREATAIVCKNFENGKFTVTNELIKRATDYPEIGFDWGKYEK
jgi:3-polyprenyl-4-hydroxybenzoate decarboxylase